MRDTSVKLGTSEFRIAMPLGALEDLAAKGHDPIALMMAGELTFPQVKALIDVSGAWAVDPERGRPGADAGALTFAEVYGAQNAGLVGAIDIAKQALYLAFNDAADVDDPTQGAESD